MTRKDLLNSCRFYKGTKTNPYTDQDRIQLWQYERRWVEEMLETIKSNSITTIQENRLDDYLHAGLREFNNDDGIPITLKALIFNRYEHWMEGTVDEFKKWYLKYYK